MLDAKIATKLRDKFPDLDEKATPKKMLEKLNAYDVIVAYKKPDGTWTFSASGSSVKDPDAQQSAIADLLLTIVTPD